MPIVDDKGAPVSRAMHKRGGGEECIVGPAPRDLCGHRSATRHGRA
jgi:hypothetical protein